jgi:hypothetical protein
MAGGYIIDPATGQPAVQTASGMLLPLGLSQGDLSAAGMPGPPGAPAAPASGPDQRNAYNGGGAMFGVQGIAPPTTDSLPTEPIKQAIGWHDPTTAGAAPGSPLAAQVAASQPAQPEQAPAPPKLVRAAPSDGGQQQAPGPDPSQEAGLAAFQDYMKGGGGGGGGGPRRLAETGESEKYIRPQFAADPGLVANSTEALGASDKYNEELAKSLKIRQDQAYQAQQGEFAARAGQMEAAQKHFDAQQNMLQDYQAKRDALAQQAAQMKTPQMEDYWQSRGTFANVMTGLSIALGGALQGLRGGENPGLQMANQSIDRWIASQKEAYNRAEGRVSDADSQYAKLVQTFGNENLATEHMRLQAWDVRDGMLKTYAQKIGTPDALENYNQAMLATEADRAKAAARASQGAQVEIDRKLSMTGGGGGGKPKTLAEAYKVAAETKKNADILNGTGGGDGKNAVILSDGSTAYATNPAEAQSAQGVIRSADEASGMLDRLDHLTQTAGKRALTEDERGQAETLKAELMPALQGVHGFKRLTDADLHLLQEMTGDPTAFARNPNARARLLELKRGVQESSQIRLKYLRRKPVGGGTETAAPAEAPGAQDEGEE